MSLKKKKITAIKLLLAKNNWLSPEKAKALFLAGQVVVNNQRFEEANKLIVEDSEIRLKSQKEFVSRAGKKLAGVIEDFSLSQDFQGKTVLDVGASTGGFTDCVLKLGAKKVIALDVGTSQLAWSLRTDQRVVCCEKQDVRTFKADQYKPFDWILVDVSFISLRSIVKVLYRLGAEFKTQYLILVKPQFEVAKEKVPQGGVIRDVKLIEKTLEEIKQIFIGDDFVLLAEALSRLQGAEGNQEFFLHLRKKSL